MKTIAGPYGNLLTAPTKAERAEGMVSYQELFMIGMEMRRALGTLCDQSSQCTCTVCRAMWGWDHYFGAISSFSHDDLELELNPATPEGINALDQVR